MSQRRIRKQVLKSVELAKKQRLARKHLALEALECRTLLASDLDTSFGNAGNVVTDFSGGADVGFGAVQSSDGKIIVVGYSYSDATGNDFALARYNANGTLDSSFGSGGKVSTNIGAASTFDIGQQAAIAADGKILVAGTTMGPSGTFDFALVRYNVDGTLDSSFGSGGKVITNYAYNDFGTSVAIAADGKIVMAGYVGNGTNNDFAVVRFNSNGTLDNTFGSGGKVYTGIRANNTDDVVTDVALASDGKIVVVGYSIQSGSNDFALVRLNTNGTLDSTFGTSGKVITNIGATSTNDLANSVAIAPDGRIVVAGYTYDGISNDFALVRYNTNGTLDNTFGSAGKVITDFGTYTNDYAYDVAITAAGKIVAAGNAAIDTSPDFALARYNADGSLDTTYSNDGKATANISNLDLIETARAILIDSTGNYILAGYSPNESNTDFAVAKFLGSTGNPNQAPTNITLSNATIAENQPANSKIGDLSTTDPNTSDSFSYSLAAGVPDNAAFQIVANELRAVASFNYEAKSSYSVRIRSTDAGGLWTEKTFAISITNVNEAPVIVSPIADISIVDLESLRVIDLTAVFADYDSGPPTFSASSNNGGVVNSWISGTNLMVAFTGYSGKAVVNVTATDSAGLQVTDQFNIQVRNFRIFGPLDGFSGVVSQDREFALDATNIAESNNFQLTYEINWGDGTGTQTISGWEYHYVKHAYATAGQKTIQARVKTVDGFISPWRTVVVNILTQEFQGAYHAFGGTAGNDEFIVTPTASSPIANVSLNSVSLGTVAAPVNGIKFYGGQGSDTITMNGTSGADDFEVDITGIQLTGMPGWSSPLVLLGGGTEKSRVNALAGNDTITIFSGNTETDGGTGTDTVKGYVNTDNYWQVLGAGSGFINGGTFKGVESIVGGDHIDYFSFFGTGSIAGSINGGGGTDTLDYSQRSVAVAVDLAKQTATGTKGISNFEVAIGSAAATDTLTAPATVNSWNIAGSGYSSLNSIQFKDFETLTGGSNTDTFNIGADVTTAPVLNGGSGTDTLSFANRSESITVNRQARSATLVPVFNTIERFIGGSGIDTLIGADTATTWTINDPTSGTFTSGSYQGFENLTGGALNDTFKLLSDTFNGTITGGLGIDTLTGKSLENTWKLTGVASGSLNDTLLFNSVENLTGGTLADNFLFYPAGTDFGMINGGSGTDSLNYSLVSGPVTINLATLTASKMANFAAIESVVGTNASDTLYGTNAATAWKLSTASSGLAGKVNFSSFENLNGGTGVDTLTGDNTANQWLINGVGAGTLNGSTSFSGMDNFTGGTADDTYVIAPSGSIPGTLGGGTGTGVNTLSYAGWSTDVVVNAIAIGSATAINLLSANFHFFIGGSGNDRLTAFSALASVLIGNAGNDTLVGSGKRDILIGGLGTDNLQGGADEDILIGGATAHDGDLVGLRAIRAEWTSTRTQALRLSNLRGIATTGLNAGRYLNNGPGVDALIDDAVADSLFGGTSTDWFITGPQDTISDLVAGEPIDSAV